MKNEANTIERNIFNLDILVNCRPLQQKWTHSSQKHIIILEKTFVERNSLEHSRPWSDQETH